MSFVENVDRLLQDKGLKRADVIRATGISEASFRKWLSGSLPNVETALKIAKYLNTTVEALMDAEAPGPDPVVMIKEEIEETEEERAILDLYRTLDTKDRETVQALLESMASRYISKASSREA